MSDSRDPRLDPVPGDVVRKGRVKRMVMEFHSPAKTQPYLFCSVLGKDDAVVDWCGPYLSQWRKWAKDSEVIAKGAGK